MRNRTSLYASLALIGMAALIVILMAPLRRSRRGAQPVAWNRDICAQCGMVVGDRSFAAQLQTRQGSTLNFDDPGCLMNYLLQRHPAVRAIYLRSSREDGWLPEDKTAFLRVPQSPSGFGLAAVPRGTPGALSWDDAMRVVQQRNQAGEMGGDHVQP